MRARMLQVGAAGSVGSESLRGSDHPRRGAGRFPRRGPGRFPRRGAGRFRRPARTGAPAAEDPLDRAIAAALEVSLALALTLLPAFAAATLGRVGFLWTWLAMTGTAWLLARPVVWRGPAARARQRHPVSGGSDDPRVPRASSASRF